MSVVAIENKNAIKQTGKLQISNGGYSSNLKISLEQETYDVYFKWYDGLSTSSLQILVPNSSGEYEFSRVSNPTEMSLGVFSAVMDNGKIINELDYKITDVGNLGWISIDPVGQKKVYYTENSSTFSRTADITLTQDQTNDTIGLQLIQKGIEVPGYNITINSTFPGTIRDKNGNTIYNSYSVESTQSTYEEFTFAIYNGSIPGGETVSFTVDSNGSIGEVEIRDSYYFNYSKSGKTVTIYTNQSVFSSVTIGTIHFTSSVSPEERNLYLTLILEV